jgi:hypothetical protein
MPITLGILAQSRQEAAAATFQLLESTVLTGSQASVEFTNLTTKYASTYQHLQIRMMLRSNAGATVTGSPGIQFNGVGGTSYSSHILAGTGSTVTSSANTSSSHMFSYYSPASSFAANAFAAYVTDILDPFETTKNTTIRSLGGWGGGEIRLLSGAFLNTASITSVLIDNRDGQSWVSGCRFSLYGVKATA